MTLRWADKTLNGWGRVQRVPSKVARPERTADLARLHAEAGGDTVLAYGAGRSYGDAALNGAGRSVDMSRLDRFVEFDADTGRLVAETGVTFADVIATFLPRGFMPPVTPGTGFATLGGGIANDVHGKNHHQAGSLGRHVEWFDLRLPSGDLRRVDAQSEPDLWRGTLGGVGLTGIVERLCLRLERVPSNAVRVRRRRLRDLDEQLAALSEEQTRSRYVVSWVDALARGRSLGRGILEAAVASDTNITATGRRAWRLPFDLPAFALGSTTVGAFNNAYYGRVPESGDERLQHYTRFLFPLDGIHDWNRLYGRRGFHQFQCVVPFEAGATALAKLLEAIAASGRGSFLAVLKAMGEVGEGYLSFARPGYTLALDFPNANGVTELIGRLERITCDHGGRTYLAKDSTLTPALVREMYPELSQFQALLARIDPLGRTDSDMARRLALRGST